MLFSPWNYWCLGLSTILVLAVARDLVLTLDRMLLLHQGMLNLTPTNMALETSGKCLWSHTPWDLALEKQFRAKNRVHATRSNWKINVALTSQTLCISGKPVADIASPSLLHPLPQHTGTASHAVLSACLHLCFCRPHSSRLLLLFAQISRITLQKLRLDLRSWMPGEPSCGDRGHRKAGGGEGACVMVYCPSSQKSLWDSLS